MGRHKEWRKLAKKLMRKKKRSAFARDRDMKLYEEEKRRTESPSYQEWLDEQRRFEEFWDAENERVRFENHNRWLEEEQAAQERWQKQQEKLERLKAEKLKQELLIREEWEREQQKLLVEAEKQKQLRQRREQEAAEMLNRIEGFIAGEFENLPSSMRTFTETQPGCEECPFFSKVAACRFRDSCSRNHVKPSISYTLLIPNFYTHFRMEHINQCNEYDTDVGLEYDEREIYDHFLEFYDDVLGELKKFGTVIQFKVCCNEESHLRGNVYVQYESERSAIKAFRGLQGRFYGGKRLSVEFCTVPSWSRALCGLFSRRRCPKGSKCNFLHTFRNPNSEFIGADRDVFRNSSSRSVKEKSSESGWSPSPYNSNLSWSSPPSPVPERRLEWRENASRRSRKDSNCSSRKSSKDSMHSRKKRKSDASSKKSHYEQTERKVSRKRRS